MSPIHLRTHLSCPSAVATASGCTQMSNVSVAAAAASASNRQARTQVSQRHREGHQGPRVTHPAPSRGGAGRRCGAACSTMPEHFFAAPPGTAPPHRSRPWAHARPLHDVGLHDVRKTRSPAEGGGAGRARGVSPPSAEGLASGPVRVLACPSVASANPGLGCTSSLSAGASPSASSWRMYACHYALMVLLVVVEL